MAAFQLNDTIFRLHVLWWNIFWQKLYRRVVSKNKTVLCAHMYNLFKLFVCFIIFIYIYRSKILSYLNSGLYFSEL